MSDTRAALSCVAAALVAGGAGLLLGLLFAPASGRETRRVWLRRAEEEAQVVERKVRRAIGDAGEQAKRYAEDTLDRGKKALSAVKTSEPKHP
jgi:gas vesicle protein